LSEARQAVPHALGVVATDWFAGAATLLLLALSAAALGSGAAVLRAMSSALSSAAPGQRASDDAALGVVALALGAFLAARGEGIVDTMVSVNVIYIASIGCVFWHLLNGRPLPPPQALRSMTGGFCVAVGAYAAGEIGWPGGDPDTLALALGTVASLVGALRLPCFLRRRAHETSWRAGARRGRGL
jgi:solute:Na+ symporter, SSS family